MRPGISFSASSISLRPKSASERSATLKSGAPAPAGVAESVVVVIGTPCVVGRARARTGFQGVGPDHWMTAADGPTGVHSTPAAPFNLEQNDLRLLPTLPPRASPLSPSEGPSVVPSAPS